MSAGDDEASGAELSLAHLEMPWLEMPWLEQQARIVGAIEALRKQGASDRDIAGAIAATIAAGVLLALAAPSTTLEEALSLANAAVPVSLYFTQRLGPA